LTCEVNDGVIPAATDAHPSSDDAWLLLLLLGLRELVASNIPLHCAVCAQGIHHFAPEERHDHPVQRLGIDVCIAGLRSLRASLLGCSA
jgi:hypothetical protein